MSKPDSHEGISLTPKEKKLFPTHEPFDHVDFELESVSLTFNSLRKVLLASCDDFTPENEHWYTALEAMIEKGIRELEQAQKMLFAATQIAKREEVSNG